MKSYRNRFIYLIRCMWCPSYNGINRMSCNEREQQITNAYNYMHGTGCREKDE